MHTVSLRKGRSGLLSIVAVFFASIVLPSLLMLPVASAAASSYTWLDPTIIKGADGNTFIQQTTDLNGRAIVVPGNGMLLIGQTNTGSTCSPGRSGPTTPSTDVIDKVLPANAQVTVQGGGEAILSGATEILVIPGALTAQSAQLVTFGDGIPTGCEPLRANTVTLTNTLAAQWISSTAIKYLSDTFTETGVSNGTMSLTGPSSIPGASLCKAEVLTVGDATNSYLSATSGTLTVSTLVGSGQGQCQTGSFTVPLSNNYISNGNTSSASWVSGSNTDPGALIQIDTVGGGDIGVINKGDIYLEPNIPNKPAINGSTMTLNRAINTGGSCRNNTNEDQMQVNPYQTAQTATLTVYHSGRGCTRVNLTIALTNLYGGAAANGNPSNPITTTDGCIIPTNDGLRWITCPILATLQSAATSANNFIIRLLIFPVKQYFNASVQSVFDTVRNIGVAILVIAGLVMVISQSADLEIFTAHSVRKALPRIIFAAIAMSVAWPLLQFVVTFFNDIGIWTGRIILSISSVAGTNDAGLSVGGAVFDSILAALGAVAAFTVLGVGGILSLLLSVVLLIGVGVFILIIRQIVLLMCILATPAAAASYALGSVFPGAEKLGRFWKDTFLATLLMFPIITAFLATGIAMASIAAAAQVSWYSVLAIVFYIAPYVMLPLAFRIAGGLMERVVSWAQGTHNQTIESRLQGYRQQRAGENVGQLQRGTRYSNNTIGRRMNNLTASLGTGIRGRFGLGIGRGRLGNQRAEAIIGLRQAAAAKQAANNPLMQQLQFDDDGMAAMFASGGREDIDGGSRRGVERLTTLWANQAATSARGAGATANAAEIARAGQRARGAVAKAAAVGINTDNFNASIPLLASNKARAITGGQEGLNFVNNVLDDATRGNDTMRSQLAGTFGFAARGAGRTDLSAIMTTGRRGAAPRLAESWQTSSMQQLGSSTDAALESFLDDAVVQYNTATTAANKRAAAIQLLEAQNILPYVAPGGQRIINERMARVGYNDARRDSGMSAEGHLVNGTGLANGGALRSMARVYDANIPQGAMPTGGGGVPPPTTTT